MWQRAGVSDYDIRPVDINERRAVINTFRGFNKVELHLIDWKPASSVQQAAG